MTGVEAGEADKVGKYPEGTVLNAVQSSLQKLAQTLKSFSQPEKGTQDGRVEREGVNV